jgi:DNA-binding IclR family transcriptional regulator
MAHRREVRKGVRREALLFNSNSMYDLLRALATIDDAFHAAALSRLIKHSRSQTNKELAKLRALGIVESRGQQGRVELLHLCDDVLADAVLELPDLLEARLAAIAADQGRQAR